jgi:hypothetical protein
MTTLHPKEASSCAIHLPIPVPPPVTIAYHTVGKQHNKELSYCYVVHQHVQLYL